MIWVLVMLRSFPGIVYLEVTGAKIVDVLVLLGWLLGSKLSINLVGPDLQNVD